MKLLIAGTRTFTDYEKLETSITIPLTEIKEIVSGGATGADQLGEVYAYKNKIPLKVFKADWNQHGKSAGPIRNKLMAEYCDHAIIFWDGVSRGTKNMIDNMKRVNKPHTVINYENN